VKTDSAASLPLVGPESNGPRPHMENGVIQNSRQGTWPKTFLQNLTDTTQRPISVQTNPGGSGALRLFGTGGGIGRGASALTSVLQGYPHMRRENNRPGGRRRSSTVAGQQWRLEALLRIFGRN
jgi:hypothetical protein